MTKQVDPKGQIWHEREGNVVKVGFTKSFLDGLEQCWHILPANNQRFREKAPLMVVETNDALISIMSPVSAHFVQWERKAQDFPDQLTENDVILEMNVQEARRAEPQAEQAMGEIRPADWNNPHDIARFQREVRDRENMQARAGGGDAGMWANAAAPQVAVRRRNQGIF